MKSLRDPLTLAALVVALIALALVAAGTALGQVKAGKEFKEHEPVILSSETEASIYTWDVTPVGEGRADVIPVGDGRTAHVWASPGRFRVRLTTITIDWDMRKTSYGAHSHEFEVIGDPCPIPPAPPAPPPSPEPPKPHPSADPVAAISELRHGRAGCTCTVVGPRPDAGRWFVLSAAHCVEGVSEATVTTKTGKSYRGLVIARDNCADLAVLVIDEPGDLPHAVIASANPAPGTAIWHQGHGVDRPGNRETGRTLSHGGCLSYMSLSVSSGDSGAGIFREDTGELVCVVRGYMNHDRRQSIGGTTDAIRAILGRARATLTSEPRGVILTSHETRPEPDARVEPHVGEPIDTVHQCGWVCAVVAAVAWGIREWIIRRRESRQGPLPPPPAPPAPPGTR